MLSKKAQGRIGLGAEVFAVFGVLFHAFLILGAWNVLPATIPVHFGLDGQPDRFGDKSEILILLVLNVVVYVGLTYLARFPHKFNYPWAITPANAEGQYRLAVNLMKVIKAEVNCLFAVISLLIVGVSLGYMAGLGSFFLLFVLGMMGITLIGYRAMASRLNSNGEGSEI